MIENLKQKGMLKIADDGSYLTPSSLAQQQQYLAENFEEKKQALIAEAESQRLNQSSVDVERRRVS